MKIIGRHNKWVKDCLITESVDNTTPTYRRFTATINGWRNFKIYEGYLPDDNQKLIKSIIERVKKIKERIENDDDCVFKENVELLSIK